MSAYSNWTLAQAREVCRRELMDAGGKWWDNTFLNATINDWQNDLQQQFELVWGTCTLSTALSTITLSSISPEMERLDAVYFIGTGGGRGYRLAGRSLQDLEVGNTEWRNASADSPRTVIQYDSRSMIVWPPLATTGTFVFEYPRQLNLPSDSSLISLPAWTQGSLKNYVGMRSYLRQGPTNDLKRALRYKSQWEKDKGRIRLLWDNWLPERYRRLKPAGKYEWDIIIPPPPVGTDSGISLPSFYRSYQYDGDGTIKDFTLPITPTDLKVYRNGLLETRGVGYSLSGSVVSFTIPPSDGDVIVVWTFALGR